MNKILYSIQEASELTGSGIETIQKFIELKAIIPEVKEDGNIKLNSFGMYRLKKISKLLDKGFSKGYIIRELDK